MAASPGVERKSQAEQLAEQRVWSWRDPTLSDARISAIIGGCRSSPSFFRPPTELNAPVK